jgi:hypothetical protein
LDITKLNRMKKHLRIKINLFKLNIRRWILQFKALNLLKELLNLFTVK